MNQINKDILKNIFKERLLNVRKYDFGLLLVIGGSEFYTGSPALSAMAAFRTGVDMVRIIAPKRAADIIASFSPNLAAFPLDGKRLEKRHLIILLALTESARMAAHGKTAVVIGGGIGRSAEIHEVILQYLAQISVPVIIETDAIYSISQKLEVISGKNFLIIPRFYEFFILTGKKIYHLPEQEKIKIIQEEANRLQTTIFFRGERDIISNGKDVAVNEIGLAYYMSKGGCGDVLAGICGALMARGISAFESAKAAAYINVEAAKIVAQKKKEGMVATDLIEAISEVLHQI